MSNVHIVNGKRYYLATSTKQFRDKGPKSIIETMAPLVAEMDRNYLKFRALMDKGESK